MNNSPEQVSPVKSVELGKSSLVNRAKIIGGRATGRTVYMPTEVTEGGPKVDLITQGHYDKLPDGTPLVGLDGTPVIKSPDLVPDTRSTRHPKLGGYEMTNYGFPHADGTPERGYIAKKRQG